MAPPPPPPPPMCFPFNRSKEPRRISDSRSWVSTEKSRMSMDEPRELIRSGSFSSSATLTSVPSLGFRTDSEKYDDIPGHTLPAVGGSTSERPAGRLVRSNTMTGTKKSILPTKWGYGWGLGKQKEKEKEMVENLPSQSTLPVYVQGTAPTRSNSKSTQNTKSTHHSKATHRSSATYHSNGTRHTNETQHTNGTHQSKATYESKASYQSKASHHSSGGKPPVARYPNDSSSTLVGSGYDRKVNAESAKERTDTLPKLEEIRALMAKDDLDYYIIPSEDAHGSEYVSPSDQRREFISGFTGSAGQAIVSKTSAYLITDSRYWLQAQDELDSNWRLVQAGAPGFPSDWINWLVDHAKDARVGIDARMFSHKTATLLNSKLAPLFSKMVYPVQNFVDLIWKDKPAKSRASVVLHPLEFTGEDASSKLAKLRAWIQNQPASTFTFSKAEPKPSQIHVGTLITSLPCIAYLLNLRGSDIPYNPVFQSYLYVGLDHAIIFLESIKVDDQVSEYLKSIDIERRDYNEIWTFLRRREWGEGKVLISPETSYAISLMLTHFRYTVAPSFVEEMMSIKNETELEGFRRAYLRDGASFVRFFSWLEAKLAEGYEITEWEAAHRLTEFRRKNPLFMGLAYENISASGPNAALPHYSPTKSKARMIDRNTPYLNDSGGQYRDGTCDTTRTVHFGRPTPEQCEAYTRVLQGHIAIDSAVFPEGTSGVTLDVLARRALWRDGLNYMHGTGHGIGSFLPVHEGPQGFSSTVALTRGHVVTNEPGFYNAGQWGVRIESALAVRRVQTRGNFNGDIWLGFERLTCVPIQTRMVKESMLTKEEKQWLKDHNQRCYEKLQPYLQDDKRALKWAKREADRGIGIVGAGPGGISIEWD